MKQNRFGPFQARQWVWAGLASGGCLCSIAEADETLRAKDLARLDLEDLMEMKVTSVSKHEERLLDAPAAVSVLTGEEIRRAGAQNLPDALRLVPGLSVAQSDRITWGISSRGFNDQYANKLLVLVDGRSVYNQLFSGVIWELQDLFLEDLERIEVVRGPGSTLWGANAVNGVINVTSKSSKDTQGVLVRAGGGSETRGEGAFRYGGEISESLHFRIYGQHRVQNMPDVAYTDDPTWPSALGGLRFDWEPNERDRFTFQGEYGYSRPESKANQWLLTPPYSQTIRSDGEGKRGHLIGRWTHEFSDETVLTWQSYGDWYSYQMAEALVTQASGDTEVSLRFPVGERHGFSVGTGYRRIRTGADGSYNLGLGNRSSYETGIANVFLQDEIDLVEDRLKATLGAKLEHFSLTGPEFMPSARLAWKATDSHTLWTAVSRAARTPSIVEYDLSSTIGVLPPGSPGNPAPLPLALRLRGSEDISTESVVAYELGWKYQPTDRISANVSVFFNAYQDQLSLEPQAPTVQMTPSPHVEAQLLGGNGAFAEAYGGELELIVRPLDAWRLRAGVSLVEAFVHVDDGSGDQGVFAESMELRSPVWQATLHSSLDLPWHLTLDHVVRFCGEVDGGRIPAYVALDSRLAWEFRPGCELAVVGRNLLDHRHPEFGTSSLNTTLPTEVERSVFASLTVRF